MIRLTQRMKKILRQWRRTRPTLFAFSPHARRSRVGDVRSKRASPVPRLRVYCSKETHTSIRRGPPTSPALVRRRFDGFRRMIRDAHWRLLRFVNLDLRPISRTGVTSHSWCRTAGTVSTGAVDPLPELAAIAREHGSVVPRGWRLRRFRGAGCRTLRRICWDERSRLVAVDPHKWLYAPLEAGCTLVRDSRATYAVAFGISSALLSFRGTEALQLLFDLGPQNSRGFRALQSLGSPIQQAGRDGYVRMISDDIRLAAKLS